MSPGVEVAEIGVCLTIVGWEEERKLAIVPHVCDDTSNLEIGVLVDFIGISGTRISNILTITTTTGSPISS